MKSNKLALAALVLWVATVAVFAWFFVRGNTVPGSDGRSAIVLAPAERGLILAEMRGLLAEVHNILDAINRNDRQQIAASARHVGTAYAADVNPAIMAKLPLPFKQLGMSVHHDMDDLAAAADSGKPVAELQAMLTATMSKCVSCHAAWELKPSE